MNLERDELNEDPSEERKMGLSVGQTAARHRNRSYISGGGTDFSLLRYVQTSSGVQPDSKSMPIEDYLAKEKRPKLEANCPHVYLMPK